jgi:hypothetical protein
MVAVAGVFYGWSRPDDPDLALFRRHKPWHTIAGAAVLALPFWAFAGRVTFARQDTCKALDSLRVEAVGIETAFQEGRSDAPARSQKWQDAIVTKVGSGLGDSALLRIVEPSGFSFSMMGPNIKDRQKADQFLNVRLRFIEVADDACR